MTTSSLLFADMAWAKLIGFIVFMVVVGINKWLAAQAEQKKKGGRPKPAKPPAVPAKAADPAARTKMEVVRDDIKQEVQAFLRQAQEQKPGQPAAPARRAQRQKKSQRPPAAPAAGAQRPLSERIPLDRPAAERPAPAGGKRRHLGEAVAEHVAEHLQTDSFSRRAAHMTDDLSRADQARQDHFEKTFSHQLGRLEDTSVGASTAERPAPAALNIVELMRDPANVRNWIVMNEIFQRPQW